MTVSILVPIYNVEKYIERCARSLFEQTYADIEYIFVNDCTPDDSIVILKKIILEYPYRKEHIRIITHEQNRGLAAARNTAIENSTGDFVMHVDSDDYLEKNAVELLVKKQLETNADIVSGNAVKETKDRRILLQEPEYKSKEEMILNCIKPTLDHVIWRRLIRLSLYKDNNIQAKEGVNVGEDWQVVPQLVYYTKKIAKINNAIYHYNCLNDNSYMSNKESCFKRSIAIQDIGSIEILEDFFRNKENKYSDQVQDVKFSYLKYYLNLAYKYKDKYAYNLIANKIINLDKKYLNDFGWTNKKARIINSNYFFRRIYETIFSVVS